MNKKIKLLENNLINKIAAGEVIERPASIVKELVENSIDAQSKNIIIEIKNGGTSFIKIQDDGIGIEKSQIKTAFLRHATSKIEKLDDLDSILTLGFRGEALASIASISMVEMISNTGDSNIGNKITIEGGEIITEEEVASLKGTTFIVKNIFFNTPARRKFLKKDSVEGGYISEIVNRLALAHPNIAFTYINNGVEVIRTYGDNDLTNTVFCIYGKEICKKLIPIKSSKNGFSIEGLIGIPELARGNRSYENFFINGRYIKSSVVQSGIEEGYNGKLMVGKFPVFIINMTVPENTVDVNVHPTKLEVRFEDENFIYNFLCDSVEKTLKKEVLIPNIEIEEEKIFSNVANTIPFNVEIQKNLEDLLIEDEEDDITISIKNNNNILMVNEEAEDEINLPKNTIVDMVYTKKQDDNKKIYKDDEIKGIKKEKEDISLIENETILKKKETITKKHSFFNNYKIVGQIFSTYWIVEQGEEVFIIDQHSAHERVIYEELSKKFKEETINSQRLIEPIVIKASSLEKATIENNIDLFLKFGFDIEEFGANDYAIRQVPFIFKSPVEPKFFTELLDMLVDKNISNVYDMKIEKIISMSCKKAVKANDRLSFVEAKALIEQLLNLENPFSCPHGRPTIIKMTKYEIEKLFKRIQN
ncbi:DNA mismatch repair endonuclease MutL [[Clostridium] colinum]|uniref:DNA mismatch repair endonuclease MutL n=1 Tax=[Clostridium] colinum TaxID=36835 RepID=UPI002024D7C7|nr:DNA mismatch repair endonuclease MutL [[Clostridium] colinum]